MSNSHWGSVVVLTSSTNLLASCCDSDDDALSPALVAGLECRSHHTYIARAVEGVVAASVRHLNQVLLDAFTAELGRVDEVGRAELLAPGLLAIIDIHDDDLFSAVLYSALDDRETYASSAKDCNVRALLYIRSHHCGPVTGGDTAAEQAGTVHWRLGSDRYNGNVGNDGVLGEGGGAHEMQQLFALALEARCSVGHDTFALGSSDLAAKVRLAGFAEFAFAALGCAGEKETCQRSSDLKSIQLEKHTREPRHCLQALRSLHLRRRTRRYQRPHDRGLWGRHPLDLFRKVCTRLPPLSSSSDSNTTVAHTCMADTGIIYFYADLVRFGGLDFNVFDGEVFACFPGYCSLESVNCMLPCLGWKPGVLCK